LSNVWSGRCATGLEAATAILTFAERDGIVAVDRQARSRSRLTGSK
jgi:hypothetical protein